MMREHCKTGISSRHFLAPLIATRKVAPDHYRLTFLEPNVAAQARAGQFMHILPRRNETLDPFLRRAFSIVSCHEETFDVLFRVMGRGTQAMSKWKIGEKVDLLGPLGQAFQPIKGASLLVGGGVGVPPLAMLAAQNRYSKNQGVTALIGARSSNEIICEDDFAQYKIPVHVATDDGSRGYKGFVTDLLEIQLAQLTQSKVEPGDQVPMIYACGPLPMLRLVAQICARYQAPCQISLEENMPCGIGVCNGCVVPIMNAVDDYGHYRRICIDGPVAWAHEIEWNHWETQL